MYRNILVPIDNSQLSELAIENSVSLASALNASLVFLNVRTSVFKDLFDDFSAGSTMSIEKIRHASASKSDLLLRRATRRAEIDEVDCSTLSIESESIWSTIITAAQENSIDLIVMASVSRGKIATFLVGSEARNVISNSSIPVLLLREPKN